MTSRSPRHVCGSAPGRSRRSRTCWRSSASRHPSPWNGSMSEPAGGPWPANARFGPDGLSVAGLSAEELVRRYGTPLLVADEDHIRGRCRTFAALFPHTLYAVKAFTSRAMIRLVGSEG